MGSEIRGITVLGDVDASQLLHTQCQQVPFTFIPTGITLDLGVCGVLLKLQTLRVPVSQRICCAFVNAVGPGAVVTGLLTGSCGLWPDTISIQRVSQSLGLIRGVCSVDTCFYSDGN